MQWQKWTGPGISIGAWRGLWGTWEEEAEIAELCGDCIVWGMQQKSLGLQELGGGVLQGHYGLERETGLIPDVPGHALHPGGSQQL